MDNTRWLTFWEPRTVPQKPDEDGLVQADHLLKFYSWVYHINSHTIDNIPLALKDALRTMGLDSEERLRNPGNHIRDETNVNKPAEATEKQAAVDKTIDLVAMEVVHRMERLEKKRIAAKQMPGQRAATPAIRAILVSVRFQKD